MGKLEILARDCLRSVETENLCCETLPSRPGEYEFQQDDDYSQLRSYEPLKHTEASDDRGITKSIQDETYVYQKIPLEEQLSWSARLQFKSFSLAFTRN